MIERLDATLARYETIEKELAKPEVLSNIKKTTELSKEMRELEDIVICYKKYLGNIWKYLFYKNWPICSVNDRLTHFSPPLMTVNYSLIIPWYSPLQTI